MTSQKPGATLPRTAGSVKPHTHSEAPVADWRRAFLTAISIDQSDPHQRAQLAGIAARLLRGLPLRDAERRAADRFVALKLQDENSSGARAAA